MTATHRASEITIDFFQILASAGSPGSTARALANWYLRATGNAWMGRNEDYQRLSYWLSAYWQQVLPARPGCCPSAVSLHGAGGRGITWYETPEMVSGYVNGIESGYLIPAREAREYLTGLHPAFCTKPTKFWPN